MGHGRQRRKRIRKEERKEGVVRRERSRKGERNGIKGQIG